MTWTLLVCSLLASAVSGIAADDPPPYHPLDSVVADPGPVRFDLGLDRVVEQRFRLFGTRDGRSAAPPAAPAATAERDGRTVLTAALVYSPEEHPIPDDLRINLKPRTWGDLSGWEKLGVVVSYAGSVAGAAYLVSRAVD